jgi:TRAP-type C4-dicarboxylate transport system permease large subunit
MDEYRIALVAIRIVAVLLLVVGAGWFFAWGLTAADDWVISGTLSARSSSFRLSWSTYAMVDTVAGLIIGRFAHHIAKAVTKP